MIVSVCTIEHNLDRILNPVNGVNRLLLTNEPLEFEKKNMVGVQDFIKITNHLRGLYGIHLNLIKENQKMSTCMWLDLETLGS